jgi:hypothetical protein
MTNCRGAFRLQPSRRHSDTKFVEFIPQEITIRRCSDQQLADGIVGEHLPDIKRHQEPIQGRH